jgi:hypothetical protein
VIFLRVDNFTKTGIKIETTSSNYADTDWIAFELSLWSWWKSKLRKGKRISECSLRYDLGPKIELGKGKVYAIIFTPLSVYVMLDFERLFKVQKGIIQQRT